jgi:uncharacterized protein with ATP-grasp and redox domains
MTAWRCDVVGTFAHKTCTVRWPATVRSLAVDVPAFAAPLLELADEVEQGVLPALTVLEADDALRFAELTSCVGQPWTSLPWYVGESFLYARIRSVLGWQQTRVDPFAAAKAREEATLPVDDDVAFLPALLRRCLWGNRGDLSLPSARAFRDERDADLVIDDSDEAVALLQRAKQVGIVLDNAGLELWRDLQLARALSDAGTEVVLFAKDRPFFVSDALPDDVERLQQRLTRQPRVRVEAPPFFTGPGFLQRGAVPDDVWQAFAACDVVVLKGDCNYRRLVGDVPWRADDRSTLGDHCDLAAPVIAVRTLKAEVLVGADPVRCADVAAQSADWLVSGRFGIISVAHTNNAVDSDDGFKVGMGAQTVDGS